MPIPDEVLLTQPWLSHILPFLYVGNYQAVLDLDLLRNRRIKRMITLMQTDDASIDAVCRQLGISRKQFLIPDGWFEDREGIVCSLLHWIHEGRQAKEAVLVHCVASISRSPALILAYCVWSGMPIEEAMRLIGIHEPAAPVPRTLESFLKCIDCKLPPGYREWFHYRRFGY